jgi:hypothetical protein
MAGDLDNLERTVERDMELLHALPAELPSPACLDRVKAAVVAEAARVSRAHRRLRIIRASLAAAAVLVLAVGASTLWPRPHRPVEPDADALLNQWAAALDESSSRVAALVDEGWVRSEPGGGGDEETELDDLLRSLDQSLTRFEEL